MGCSWGVGRGDGKSAGLPPPSEAGTGMLPPTLRCQSQARAVPAAVPRVSSAWTPGAYMRRSVPLPPVTTALRPPWSAGKPWTMRPRVVATPFPRGSMDILAVDDDALSLRLLIALVEKLGHRPISASDGLTAWELYRKHDCRVVISDWNMPGLDGIELLTRIRSVPGLGYTYFIMLTSRSDREDVAAGMKAGADDLLIKPISRDDLEVRLNVARRIVSLQMQLSQRNHELSSVNERMRQDLQAAVRVQEALLPVQLPRIDGLDFAWLYRPCDQLGGDTLNLYRPGA